MELTKLRLGMRVVHMSDPKGRVRGVVKEIRLEEQRTMAIVLLDNFGERTMPYNAKNLVVEEEWEKEHADSRVD